MTQRLVESARYTLLVSVLCGLSVYAEEAAPDKDAKSSPLSAALHVYLVRHAEAFKNLPESKVLAPEKLDSLTPKGIEQAQALGKQLHGKPIARVIASPTGRTRQTAALIVKELGGELQVTEDAAFAQAGSKETADEMSARLIAGIQALAKSCAGKAVVIVTHGDVCPMLAAHAAKTAVAQGPAMHLFSNGSMREIIVDGEQWSLVKESQASPVNAGTGK